MRHEYHSVRIGRAAFRYIWADRPQYCRGGTQWFLKKRGLGHAAGNQWSKDKWRNTVTGRAKIVCLSNSLSRNSDVCVGR